MHALLINLIVLFVSFYCLFSLSLIWVRVKNQIWNKDYNIYSLDITYIEKEKKGIYRVKKKKEKRGLL